MISRSLILQILQAAKIMRRFFYEAPAEIMRNYTTCTVSLVDSLDQCFSTFWASSPGLRQIFPLLSRLHFFV